MYCLGLLLLELIGGGWIPGAGLGELCRRCFTSATPKVRELFADERVPWDAREAQALVSLAARCLVADPAARPSLQELLPVPQLLGTKTLCSRSPAVLGLNKLRRVGDYYSPVPTQRQYVSDACVPSLVTGSFRVLSKRF